MNTYRVEYETRQKGAIGIWSTATVYVTPSSSCHDDIYAAARLELSLRGLEVRFPVSTPTIAAINSVTCEPQLVGGAA